MVEGIRPELHRYCARLTGSVIEGEDIVQEALAKALYALSMQPEIPMLRPWLFRIAQRMVHVIRNVPRVFSARGVELVVLSVIAGSSPLGRPSTEKGCARSLAHARPARRPRACARRDAR